MRILTKPEIEKIKADLVELVDSGNAPKDLMEHLEEMGASSPRILPTGTYDPKRDNLSSGHWRMIADKWLGGIPGEPSSLEKLSKALDSIIAKAAPARKGAHVAWNSSGGMACGTIEDIITTGSYKVPGTSVKITGSVDSPAAVIKLHADNHKPTGQIVAHKLSSLTEIR